jgi:UDP-N-acetylglucosamine 2-epimerase (non-hydrolysing)
VAHVEAGLRSFDRTMPEEINRLLTDAISELLLASEPSGVDNLRHEGIPEEKIRLVGNVMIDTLLDRLPAADARQTSHRFGLEKRGYGFVTIHRPSNVDDPATLAMLVELLHELAQMIPMVFAVHPRTLEAAKRSGLAERLAQGSPRLICLGPLDYLDTISLLSTAAVVLTDSGGIQEETTVLGVPCLTLRDNTERPLTLELGTNRLVGNDPTRIRAAFCQALEADPPGRRAIPQWDGRASSRVAAELARWLGVSGT